MIMVVYMFVASAVVLCNSLIMVNSFLLGYLSLRANFLHLHISSTLENRIKHNSFVSQSFNFNFNIHRKKRLYFSYDDLF